MRRPHLVLRLAFLGARGAVWRLVPHVDRGDRRPADAILIEFERRCPRLDEELRSRWLLRHSRQSLRCVQEAYRVVYRDADHGEVGPNAALLSICSGPAASGSVAIDRSPSTARNFKAGGLGTRGAELPVEGRDDRFLKRYFYVKKRRASTSAHLRHLITAGVGAGTPGCWETRAWGSSS